MSGPGFLGKKSFVLGANSAQRFTFSNDGKPWASFMVYRASGASDASFRVWTSNFSERDVLGGQGNFGLERPLSTGTQADYSDTYAYWYAEPGASGSCFTGSVSDAPSPFAFHLVDVGTKHIMVEVSSSVGGNFILYPHLKG